MSLGGTQPGKEDPSPSCREGRRIRWSPRAVCPTIQVEWLGDSWMSSMRSPILKDMEGAANQWTSGISHWPSPGGMYACHGKTSYSCSIANPNSWDPTGEHSSQMWTWRQKANTITRTNIQYNESLGVLTLKKTHLWEIHGTVDICLKRQLVLRLLLAWHSGKVNQAPHCVPLDQVCWQNHILLTQCS